MMFDWIAFCRGNNIPFVTEGPNVARNDVNIRCPWCGDDDPSEHMGLSRDPHRPWFGCWRNPRHRGSNPARLIARLLGCTDEAARAIVEAGDVTKIDHYAAIASKMRHERVPERLPPKRKPLQLPREFKPITRRGTGRVFFDYLRDDRGFDDIEELVERYDLRYCMTGHFRYRVILPVFDVQGVLVSWTGRDVTGRSAVRYRSLSDNPEKAELQGYPPATVNLKSTVLNADLCRGGERLFICEGPFDALKLDWYANSKSNAVAVFGMPESQQLAVLCRIARVYESVSVVLDRDAKARSIEFVEALRALVSVPVQWRQLPIGVKDPAQLAPKQARKFLSETPCTYPRATANMLSAAAATVVGVGGGKTK